MRSSFRAILTALVLVFCPLTWVGQAAEPVSRVAVPPGWQAYRGPSGLVVLTPRGWRVHDTGDGFFLAAGPGPGGAAAGVLALAQPVRVDGRAEGVVRGMGQAFPNVFPGVRVSGVQTLSGQPEVAVGRLDYLVNGRPYQGVAMCYKQGDQGMIYAAAADSQIWPGQRSQALAVLRGFLYASGPATGPDQAAGPPLPPMIQWADPQEKAFSCVVPQGWRVEGGLKRLHAIDVRPELVVESPDNGVLVRLGDAGVPSMVLPNEMMVRTGFTEGKMYSPGYGLNQLVLRYLPGARFAVEWYLPQRVEQLGDVRETPLTELTRQVMEQYAKSGLPTRADIGEVTFACQTPQGPRRGYAFVKTVLVTAPDNNQLGTWRVEMLAGYLARADQEPLARAVLNEMARNFRFSPEWLTAQAKITGSVSVIVAETQERISGMIRDSFNQRQRTMDQSMERYVRGAIRGTVLVEDPNTNERFEVPGGSNYYWRPTGGDVVVGTDTDTRPYSPNHWLERLNVLD